MIEQHTHTHTQDDWYPRIRVILNDPTADRNGWNTYGVTFLLGFGMGKVELAYLFLHSLCNAVQRYEGKDSKEKKKKKRV